ncbi:MAG: AAA family ATPase [Nitrospiraceae bacterium]|nr:MAG: AAA family ATPase [Nitrospiraceae bacterium]
MYTKHFGLHKLPFENVPDPLFFFDEGDYHQVRSRVDNSLAAGRGLIIVTGPIGSGKTTLSQMIKTDFSKDIKLIWMAEPPGSSNDLLLFLVQELGLQTASQERVFVLRDIREALLKIISQGGRCLMIIDESHLMTDDTLNGIRLLNNLEEGSTKLIQVLLLGQEEILEKINRPEMEPFKQRIASLEIIGQMDSERVKQYVTHRIHVAGGEPSLLTDTGWEAVRIAFQAGGTPRTINSLMDRTFTVAHEREKKEIDAQDVYEASQRLGLKTDVFHYIVSLKSREREQRSHAAESNESVMSPEREGTDTHQEPPKPLRAEAAVHQEAPRPVYEKILDAGQKGLKVPIILLIIAIIAFILSFSLYCNRTNSPDLFSCILDLLGL